ncbi:dTDP-4-dehydrorhamnose reductase [Polynucleobacter victoriensis]|uniref:dTDP-4-dehydrorhamnose reductase n=1 Tax=Polynucleobacter victoriensis TaxID=2049319 RepID=A0A212T8X0_9BURK|nr:dTDP-4-dehydrorhamnose reductase [Polynucleobacter victoriensis]SNC62244.1 dTDP-4-dehydrorhamnose reductase [Polynucleobacter victoriensis]
MSYSSFELLDHSRPIVVFGRDGQVGRALQICLKDLKVPTVFLGRADCDLTSESSIVEVLNRYQPQVIINAAAYTAVDKAEAERDLAFAINAKAPELIARYIANVAHGILVHYSTDYVFADTSQTAYLETDIAGPLEQLSAYGQSKLAGEQAIEEAFNLAHDSGNAKCQDGLPRYLILRTSWVYGDGENFIQKILRLAAKHAQLEIVNDQIGVPTSADWLAKMSMQMIDSNIESGIYHVVPDGETSWHGLAVLAIEAAIAQGECLDAKPENVIPIPTVEYSMKVRRPYNSRLNNTKLKKALSSVSFTEKYPEWQDQVRAYIKENVVKFLSMGMVGESH